MLVGLAQIGGHDTNRTIKPAWMHIGQKALVQFS